MKRMLDRYSLGRALTKISNSSATDLAIFDTEFQEPASRAIRIGLTGAPGAGKSTLAGRLGLLRAASDRRVALLAIDPTSPRTAGAILGDRIRMDDLEGSEQLYIRSLGSRSAGDGLTDNLYEMLSLMDRYEFDEVLLETVGVGQAEHAARTQVDTLVLILPPDGGDVIQAMKAGIMELADIYVINKADMPAAQKMASEIKRVLALTRHRDNQTWVPPVLLTSACNPSSIEILSREIDRHQQWLMTSGRYTEIAIERKRYRLRRLIERNIEEIIKHQSGDFFDRSIAQQVEDLLSMLFQNQPKERGHETHKKPEVDYAAGSLGVDDACRNGTDNHNLENGSSMATG